MSVGDLCISCSLTNRYIVFEFKFILSNTMSYKSVQVGYG